MSGAMLPAMREATDKAIFRAAARKFAPQAVAIIKRATPAKRESLPARTWLAMDETVRDLLILWTLGEDWPIKAKQSWEHFTDAQRDAIAANARFVSGQLRNAGCLW